jgi:ribosomal protein S18 acetylase RimI-like enzyme
MTERSDIVIRPCRPDDIPEVRAIAWKTWVDTYGIFIPEADIRSYHDAVYAEEALRERMVKPGTYFYLGLLRGTPAGYLILQLEPEKELCSVGSVYVLPEFQREGIGRRMMRLARDEGRRAGCRTLRLGVMEQNRKARDWYERQGFRFSERVPFAMGSTTVVHLIGTAPIDMPENA